MQAAGRGGATINTGAATQSYISGQTFTQIANPQVNDVLQRIPRRRRAKARQPYETQVLIDGHPIALGQYGMWLSQ